MQAQRELLFSGDVSLFLYITMKRSDSSDKQSNGKKDCRKAKSETKFNRKTKTRHLRLKREDQSPKAHRCDDHSSEDSFEQGVTMYKLVEKVFKMLKPWKMSKKEDNLGEGGFGKVVRVMHKKTGQMAAMKIIKVSGTIEEEKKVMGEIEILRKMKHDNIIRYLEHEVDNHKVCILMEVIDQNLLDMLEMLSEDQGLPPDTIVDLCIQIVNGLIALHGQKIFHNDLKPSNILIDNDGCIKLCDFGTSRSFSDTKSLHRNKSKAGGTASFMPPQYHRGEATIPYAIDIWSLGCVIVQLATRSENIWGEADYLQIPQLLKQNKRPIIGNKVHPSLLPIIEQCLSLEPSQRPTAVELKQRLLALKCSFGELDTAYSILIK